MEEKQLNEKESLELISQMIVYINQKVAHISIEKYTSYQQEWK